MSKTLYIETNEEITSIIDRVKDVEDSDVILVIPKKAVILQSILNLKILKKQLRRWKKEAVIVTSDKLGKNIAARADFIVKQKLDERNSSDADREQEPEGVRNDEKPVESPPLRVSDIIKKGTPNIFTKAIAVKSEDGEPPKLVPKEVNNEKSDKSNLPFKFLEEEKVSINAAREKKDSLPKRMNVFADGSSKAEKVIILPSFGKKLLFAILALTLMVAGVILFLVLPTATLSIEPKTELITQDINPIIDQAVTEVDKNELKIPGKLIEVSNNITKEFPVTGKKQVKAKASGVVTVYNDWDSQSQTLVESTRFISDEGKLFRSKKTVVVPGFKRSAGEDLPGSVTVEVEADEAGEESNIPASRFSIPGLKGTVKYEKIYGVSKEPMVGGRVEQITVVSDDDFNKAKKAMEKEVRETLVSEIKSKSDGQTTLMEDAISISKNDFTASKKVGEEAKTFSLTLKLDGAALSFNEHDLIDLVKDTIKVPFNKYTVLDDPRLTYGKVEADFKNGRMIIKVYSESTVASKIEKNDILNNIKGKNTKDLQDYFANVSEVENVNIKFWPSWVKSVPRLDSNVNIDIK